MKKLWIWVIVVLVVLIIIVAVMNFLGKGNKATSTEASISVVNAQAIADRLYALMSGLTVKPASRTEVESTLKQVSELNDTNFKAVWNAFGKKEGDSLAEWADSEWYVSGTIADGIKNKALQLGLS